MARVVLSRVGTDTSILVREIRVLGWLCVSRLYILVVLEEASKGGPRGHPGFRGLQVEPKYRASCH